LTSEVRHDRDRIVRRDLFRPRASSAGNAQNWAFVVMPIGWPEGKFGPLARKPVAEVAYADRWGAAWPA
jgi:hypothetical protein